MFHHDPTTLAAELLDRCVAKGLTIVTAESCTGGLVAALLTSISGASEVLDRGFVTYSNSAKHEMLGVSEALLEKYGAVSREVACAMAQGAINHTKADLAVAVTGIAGPHGGSVLKPVAQKRDHKPVHHERRFGNRGRDQVRHASVIEAIAMLRQVAE
jgi:nicotinamide-nucleotide amidase